MGTMSGAEQRKGRRDALKRYALVAVVVAQFAVPAVALLNDPPSRFGFQMYSGLGGAKVKAVDADGQPVKIIWRETVAGILRPDLTWADVLPEKICETTSAAVAVTIEEDGRQRTLRCG